MEKNKKSKLTNRPFIVKLDKEKSWGEITREIKKFKKIITNENLERQGRLHAIRMFGHIDITEPLLSILDQIEDHLTDKEYRLAQVVVQDVRNAIYASLYDDDNAVS